MRKLWLAALTILLTVPTMAVADEAGKGEGVNLNGIGLLFSRHNQWLITPEQYIPVHESADPKSAHLGVIKVLQSESGESYYAFIEEHQEEKKNPSFLERLRGDTMRTVVTQHPLATYVTEKDRKALLIENQDKSWLRINPGWFERGKYLVENAHFVTWGDAIDFKELPEFDFPDERHEERKIEKIETMRRTAIYAPIGDVAVYKDASTSTRLMAVQLPLRFSVLQRKGNWMKVFLAVGTCDISLGKSDYREGGTGWVQILDADKGMQIIRQEQKCR